MKILATYVTDEGERELVLVAMPPGERSPFALLDARTGVLWVDADVRVVADDRSTEAEARTLATDYARRSTRFAWARRGGPSTPRTRK
jgi:hypothetical protein